MKTNGFSVVTGAFGYTGRYIARQILSEGKAVKTLTGHPDRPNPFAERVAVAPFNFDNQTELARSLEGAEVLYNTYWVRFPRGDITFDRVVENSRTLIRAAVDAGVRRIVHISITGASSGSPLPYLRGKGLVEEAITASTLSYAIIRPTVVFGREDILINNIAWFLRRFPVFTVFGSGDYRVQPVYVGDVAEIAVNCARQRDSLVIDAAGPETYAFNEMLRLIADKTGARARIFHLRPGLARWLSSLVGLLVRDVVVTRDEVEGLSRSLLVSDGPPTGSVRLSEWLERNADWLGTSYVSELRRHYR